MEPEGLRMVQAGHDTTLMGMAPEEIEDIERGFHSRKLNEPEDLATKVTQLIKLNEREEGVKLWKKHTIYKVHAAVAAVNPVAFTPKVVSMGPYHHGKKHLMPMEVHKQRAARRFILVSKKSIKNFIDGLWEVLPELMDSYSQLDRVWREDKSKERFLKMMLIDGCFLLEILRIIYEGRPYNAHDPVFSPTGILSHGQLGLDMLMLENQVPFTALVKLLTIQNGNTYEENSKKIKDRMCGALFGRKQPDASVGIHMLDVARNYFFEEEGSVLRVGGKHEGLAGAAKKIEKVRKDLKDMIAAKKSRSVMELCRAGVKFRKAEDETIPLSRISFENGVITIPVIPLYFFTEGQGCNMVAFELIHPGTSFPAFSYFTFMKGLLTSAADVRHLREQKIILSTESSDGAIVNTFKRIVKGGPMLVLPDPNLYQVQERLDIFFQKWTTGCTGRIWEWFTSLKQKYFNNPWTFIAVVSATLFLALAMTRTYYAGLPHWDSKHRKNN